MNAWTFVLTQLQILGQNLKYHADLESLHWYKKVGSIQQQKFLGHISCSIFSNMTKAIMVIKIYHL